jgi:hypothetical protein
VKITPAHDFNDYEVGRRHQLPMINILTFDGDIRESAEVYDTGTVRSCGLISSSRPSASTAATIALRAAKRSIFWNSAGISLEYYEVGRRHQLPMINILTFDGDIRESAEVYDTKGNESDVYSNEIRVIFTQPVPFSMSACSSPTIGMRRLTSGSTTNLPIRSL